MNQNKTQSSLEESSGNVAGLENPGAITGSPSTDLPGSAISTEKLTPSDFDYKSFFADQTHTYIRGYIQAADQKATFYFAFFAAIIAYSDTTGFLQKWIVDISNWKILEAVSFLSALLLVLSAFGFLWVVKPRLSGSKRGLVFFKAISEFDSQGEYFAEIASKPVMKLYEEKVKHTFELAKVCSNKYRILGISLWLGGSGFALLILLVLFGPET
jgi:pycsar effector protein